MCKNRLNEDRFSYAKKISKDAFRGKVLQVAA